MFGLSAEKLLLIGVIAAFLIGPQRLPAYARSLGLWARKLSASIDDLKERAQDELDTNLDDVDWRALDPRQYDPRKIITAALEDTEGKHST